jgi:hypothetical protein
MATRAMESERQAWQARALAAESVLAAYRTVLEPLVETLHDRLAGGVLAQLLRLEDPGRLLRRALDGWIEASAHGRDCDGCDEGPCQVGMARWLAAERETGALLGPGWRDLTPAVLGDQGDAAVEERGACEGAVAEVLQRWGFTWDARDPVAWDEAQEDADLWPNGREDTLAMVREVVDAIRARGPRRGGDAHDDDGAGGGDVRAGDGADGGHDGDRGSPEGERREAVHRDGLEAGGGDDRFGAPADGGAIADARRLMGLDR